MQRKGKRHVWKMSIRKLFGVAVSVSVVWMAIIAALFTYKSVVSIMDRNRKQEQCIQSDLYANVFDAYSI